MLDLGAAAVIVAFGLVYLISGPGFILDDWWALGNAEFDSWWLAAGTDQWMARPGAAAIYAVEFGLLGDHGTVIAIVQVSVVATTAALFSRLLRTFVPAPLASATAVLWALLPNHTSLEMWASALNIAIAQLLLVAAMLVARNARSARERVQVATMLVAASLCYEAIIPAAAIGVVAVPYLVSQRFDRRLVASSWAALAACSIWIFANWHPAKGGVHQLADLEDVLIGHFGRTVFGNSSALALLVLFPLFGSALVAWAATTGTRWKPRVETVGLVASGWAALCLGALPFLFYFYPPLGAGDRVTVVSGFGGAMIWAGLGWELWQHRRALATALTLILLAAATTTHVHMAQLYSTKAAQGRAILAQVLTEIDDPTEAIYVGPEPLVDKNVVAFLDHSNIQPALRLAYDDPTIIAYQTHDVETFESVSQDQRVSVR
jgi:hypothetical protein